MTDLSRKGLKLSHLRLAAALGRYGQISAAADSLGISQPAASRLAAEIEGITGAPAYLRSGRGIELTPEGRALADRAERIFSEIEAVGRDITELSSGAAGHVRIGAVTGPALEYVLPLVRNFRVTRPELRFHVEVATSDILCEQIAEGKLDLAIARLLDPTHIRDFGYHPLGDEPVSLVVRTGHPALSGPSPAPIRDLLRYDWLLPATGTVLRSAVDTTLRNAGHPSPPRTLTTSSSLLLLATIQQTNAIAPMASAVAKTFSHTGAIRDLASDLAFSAGGYGIITRDPTRLSPAAAQVYRRFVEMSAQIPASGPKEGIETPAQ